MNRRDFLKAAPASALLVHSVANAQMPASGTAAVTRKLDAFDYHGVRLRPSRWQQQFESGRNFYLNLSNDDILYGFRAAANQKASGKPLGGWCGVDSSITFGQWLSGMSRIAAATDDAAMREKAITLFTEWAKTIGADGNARMDHYAYDKVVCGLVDIARYAGHRESIAALTWITTYADKTF